MVSGHIDGTGKIIGIQKDDTAIWFTIQTKPEILNYIVEKGSIAIDGISLTAAKIEKDSFSVSAIPHTVKQTILHERKEGSFVNLEADVIGKYIEKLLYEDSEKGQVLAEIVMKRNLMRYKGEEKRLLKFAEQKLLIKDKEFDLKVYLLKKEKNSGDYTYKIPLKL